jgi:hypothetical protein
MSIWMGFSEIKEGGVNSFLGHSEQELKPIQIDIVYLGVKPLIQTSFAALSGRLYCWLI